APAGQRARHADRAQAHAVLATLGLHVIGPAIGDGPVHVGPGGRRRRRVGIEDGVDTGRREDLRVPGAEDPHHHRLDDTQRVQRRATCRAGSAENTKPVENTSHSSGLSCRWFWVAQSTTCRSTTKPASSICWRATSAFLYMNSYSLVAIQRTGCLA